MLLVSFRRRKDAGITEGEKNVLLRISEGITKAGGKKEQVRWGVTWCGVGSGGVG